MLSKTNTVCQSICLQMLCFHDVYLTLRNLDHLIAFETNSKKCFKSLKPTIIQNNSLKRFQITFTKFFIKKYKSHLTVTDRAK